MDFLCSQAGLLQSGTVSRPVRRPMGKDTACPRIDPDSRWPGLDSTQVDFALSFMLSRSVSSLPVTVADDFARGQDPRCFLSCATPPACLPLNRRLGLQVGRHGPNVMNASHPALACCLRA